jgi:Peptidase inhibitor family I36
MIHIRTKALAVLSAVLALGVAIAVPGFAGAEEEAPPAAPPSGEAVALAEESCPAGNICVWPQNNFQGARGMTACSAVGYHGFAGFKSSIKNRCNARGAAHFRYGEGPYGCTSAEKQNGSTAPSFDGIKVLPGNC